VPFYSAIAEQEVTRVIPSLANQGDPAYWHVVPVVPGVELHFALLNPDTGPMGRIIAALTGSPSYHVETWIEDDAPATVQAIARAGLGLPYDWDGALLAYQNTGYHTAHREFCSGWAWEMLQPVLHGLQPYPNPGKLMLDVAAMTGQRLALPPVPPVSIGQADLDYLDQLHDAGKIACGIQQQVLAALPPSNIA
jgi:hypothetical protein